MFRFLFKLILVTALFQTTLYSEEVKVFEFTEKELSELTVRKVRGQIIKLNILLALMKMVITLKLLLIMLLLA